MPREGERGESVEARKFLGFMSESSCNANIFISLARKAINFPNHFVNVNICFNFDFVLELGMGILIKNNQEDDWIAIGFEAKLLAVQR